jgi:hypothetical protein
MSLTRHVINAAALAIVILPSAGMAQSVLERVLGQIGGATNLARVNGVYANIAESVGTSPTTMTEAVPVDLSNAASDTVLWRVLGNDLTVADLGTTYTAYDGTDVGFWMGILNIGGNLVLAADGSLTQNTTGRMSAEGVWGLIYLEIGETASIPADALVYDVGGTLRLLSDTNWSGLNPETSSGISYYSATDLHTVDVTNITPGFSTIIDGSITNIITGVTSATQEAVAGAATATEVNLPTFDLGDMATTALGAVNTGEITLGVNSAVDEAKTSSTRAISAVMTQIGGSADTGALVLNVASNASAVNGSIENVMMAVNGSIGSASTTALGAVNTGTITSGVNAAVQGIVGLSGQSASGL